MRLVVGKHPARPGEGVKQAGEVVSRPNLVIAKDEEEADCCGLTYLELASRAPELGGEN